jgi:5-methylcytosine-specific restriction protein A
VYDSPAYRRMRARVISAWINDHGPWCPGYRVPAHVSYDLTLDHDVPLEHGGAGVDERNAGVLCRACNARKRDAT